MMGARARGFPEVDGWRRDIRDSVSKDYCEAGASIARICSSAAPNCLISRRMAQYRPSIRIQRFATAGVRLRDGDSTRDVALEPLGC